MRSRFLCRSFGYVGALENGLLGIQLMGVYVG